MAAKDDRSLRPMSREELAGLGLTDETLFAEHAAYYRDPAIQPHPHSADTHAAQILRRRVFREVSKAWYSGMPRLHPG